MLEDITIKEIVSPLSSENFLSISETIKTQNPDSILSSISSSLLKRYLEILIKSENLFLYTCEHEKKFIGYAILTKKPIFLFNEFKDIKYLILINLIIGFKLKAIINIFLSITKFDLLLISKENKLYVSNNLNLNLLAINNNFQSKGIGRKFILSILNDLNKKYNFNKITVETYSKRAESFYEKKLDFNYVGKKLRFFKNLNIYKKEF